ncbi:MAG: ribulose-phosphate 3-epimerase [Ignavibacteriota bacterium]|nr:MAG: ribulose-phosphate 3-epimerase [Chlorobiota bacterium]MBE7478034.1 ribulose-phosphate 3-epimerase [Ignavibacteriales bacterium]MBL1123434.1 ribulose-phosphate 3-epimerase [Ignavibacteriota bacterium]MCC7094532.1 ribulose-phosphate 3-epimerase [Ignavibacteriaceae bacterium]MCE7856621.1 ribulose-phosphate 3-epimerase [Ignavibacteria bacterium CHB3]MEB2297322.1 ribulose-phosphate 3-epimerase [Ignavibacteria bacterium]
MTYLAPSILSADFSNLSQQIRMTEMGGADWIHCDVMDGHFVPNITIGPVIVKAVRKTTKLPVDVHLMIENPDKYLEAFAEAGANYISVHVEEVVHLNRTVNRIKELGCKAGVVINPATPVSALTDIAEYIDLLLIMTVNPGFGGQEFIPNSIRRIEEAVILRSKLNANFLIEIDGGVNSKTIVKAKKAGADIFVAGSAIFHSDNITASTAELRNLIK